MKYEGEKTRVEPLISSEQEEGEEERKETKVFSGCCREKLRELRNRVRKIN